MTEGVAGRQFELADSDLQAVIAGCQRNERDSQRRLYEAYRDRVYRTAFQLVGGDDADDVGQQAFIRTFRTIRQFQGASRFETWLFRLVVNECLQFLRSKRRRPATSLAIEPPERGASPVEQLADQELINAALARLEPDLRTLIVLREVEQFSYEEIAATMELSAGTVASRLHRARQELKDALVRLGWEP